MERIASPPLIRCLFACVFLLTFAAPVGAESPAEAAKVNFEKEVWPIFTAHCNDCHGELEQEGQLRTDSKTLLFAGGVSGDALVPGQPTESLLLKRVLGEGDHEQMPLDEEPLSKAEIGVLRRWIEQGAPWPDGIGSSARSIKKHWAYETPVKAALPKVKQADWVAHPIDAFVLAQLEAEGLMPSPAAQRTAQLRRVYLDLIGLPPSADQVAAFLKDDSEGAYERAVDKLLASPRYGERWARPWLDLARYADSNGYQADQYRSVWPYRDWVINALNDDMPFDQFTLEQIAGDLLPNATLEQKIATGFHRLTTCNVEAGVDPEENRVNQVIDRVNTTGYVWLGTTLECAQCHNHKYDPITQRDYYQMFAFFNNTPLEVKGNGVQYEFTGPTMDLPLTTEQEQERAKLLQDKKLANDKLAEFRKQRMKQFTSWKETQISKESEDEPPQAHPLKVVDFNSSGGADHQLLQDGSVLISGKKPDHDLYTLKTTCAKATITGFRLETLTHNDLPSNGPGRHLAPRPNFVLHEFIAKIGGKQLVFETAEASFSQPNYAVKGAVDGDPKTAWAIAPKFGEDHDATFYFAKPLTLGENEEIEFQLDQHYGDCRTIGRLRISAMTGRPRKNGVPERILKLLVKTKRSKKEETEISNHYLNLDPAHKKHEASVAAIEKKLAALKPITTLVMIEEEKPRETHVFKRGDFLSPADAVKPNTLSVLPPMPHDAPKNRIGLAKWLVSKENPLTPRVVVNRAWAEIFGHGLVASEEDLGSQSDPPTHPKLLDWLARDFVESGWSQKHLHKQIVMSNTYRQASTVSPELHAIDAQNKFYARGPRFRLSAESIRDNALAISGLLTHKLGGPPVYPPQPDGIWRHVGRNAPKYTTSKGPDRFRRGIYVFWRRSAPYPSFTNFDAPDRASCVVRRARTNTPLQALTLLNDPAYLEIMQAFAERMQDDRPQATPLEQLAYGFQLCTCRMPSDDEQKVISQMFDDELTRYKRDPAAAHQLVGGELETAPTRAAILFLANVYMNLDETITKN